MQTTTVTEELFRDAMNMSNFIRCIDIMHGTSQLNLDPFLTPILVLPEFSFFQHVAENTDDKYIIESFAIFNRLINVLNIEVKN